MRKHYINKKSFKWRYTLFLFLLMLIVTGLVSLTIYFTLWIELLKGEALFDEIIIRTGKILFGKIGILLILEGILCFLISHRITGPIYRIERILETIQSGDLSRNIQIRKTDDLVGLVKGINQLVEVLREQTKEWKGLIDELESNINELKTLLSKEEIDKKRIVIEYEEMEKVIGRLKDIKNHFKLQ